MLTKSKFLLKIRLIPIAFWLLTIIWLAFILVLSSQNGKQTAKTSGGIAQVAAEAIYQQPSETQVNKVHLNIRKSAHVSLFFVLGVLSFSASVTTFGWKSKRRKCLSVAIPLIITVGYGFYDEWQKQFIVGRHFQPDEALLNIISGVAGVVMLITIMCLFKIVKKRYYNKM